MRVLALMKYGPRAASTRQRLLQYRPYLERNGVDITLSPLLNDDYLVRLAVGTPVQKGAVLAAYVRRLAQLVETRQHDVLWVQYELFPYLPGLFERLAGLTKLPIILDYDDAIFHGYDRHPSRLVRQLLGRKLSPLIQRAEVCLCGNAYLAQYASRFTNRAVIVPTVVDTRDYRPSGAKGEGRVVGWIGSPSTWSNHLEPLAPDLISLARENTARLRVVGAGPTSKTYDLESLEWREDREIADIQGMTVGVMPLPDDDWSRGKCGYKLIQYMACGLPVIASPVGVNTQIVEHGVNGFLASTLAEWRDAFRNLFSDPSRRVDMGERGRAKVVTQYSLASQEHRILKFLHATAARQGGIATAEF